MKRDPASIQKNLLLWLLQDPPATPSSLTQGGASKGSRPGTVLDAWGAAERSPSFLDQDFPNGETVRSSTEFQALEPVDDIERTLDPLDSQEWELSLINGQEEADFSPHSGTQPLQPGETSTVQDRFHQILKSRLQAEFQHHPPLFPWETEVLDYEADPAAIAPLDPQVLFDPGDKGIAAAPQNTWVPQLQALNLPIPIQPNLLAQLLQQCQQVVQLSLKEGSKLVQAVESLFPGQSQTLNHLAGLVLVSPARSGTTTLPSGVAGLSADKNRFAASYDQATPVQQMVLSLLAAREMLRSLTLTVSPAQPQVERQWLTTAGTLTLQVQYQPQDPQSLKVVGRFPEGGCLKLTSGDQVAIANRTQAGAVSVELLDWQLEQQGTLEVTLHDQSTLNFAVSLSLEISA